MIKKYFHLVSGEVMFRDPTQNDAIGGLKLNSILQTPGAYFTAKDLGKAQTAMQVRFYEAVGDPNLVVYDVHIMAISALGKMSDAQFAAGHVSDQGAETDEASPADPATPEPTKLPGLGLTTADLDPFK